MWPSEPNQQQQLFARRLPVEVMRKRFIYQHSGSNNNNGEANTLISCRFSNDRFDEFIFVYWIWQIFVRWYCYISRWQRSLKCNVQYTQGACMLAMELCLFFFFCIRWAHWLRMGFTLSISECLRKAKVKNYHVQKMRCIWSGREQQKKYYRTASICSQ